MAPNQTDPRKSANLVLGFCWEFRARPDQISVPHSCASVHYFTLHKMAHRNCSVGRSFLWGNASRMGGRELLDETELRRILVFATRWGGWGRLAAGLLDLAL